MTAGARSRERYRRIVISSSVGVFSRGLSMAAGFLLVPLLLSYFGKEGFGLWSAIISTVTWAQLFNLGLIDALVNLVSEGHGREDRVSVGEAVASAMYILLGFACVVGAALAVVSRWVSWSSVFAAGGVLPEEMIAWAVAAAAVPALVSLPTSVVRQVYVGYQRAYVVSAFEAIGLILTLGGVFWALHARASFPVVLFVYCAGATAAMLGNLVYMRLADMRWMTLSPRHVTKLALRRLARLAVPLFLFQVGALLVNYTQPLILAHRADLSTVAEYSVLTRLVNVVGSLILLSTNAFVPAFREASERGDQEWTKRGFQRMMAARMVMAVVAALAFAFLGNFVLRIWLGPAAIRLGTVVWVLAGVNFVASAWGSGFTQLLTIMDRIWVLVAAVMLNGICTVVLTMWLAPAYGVSGALVAIGFFTLIGWSWWGPSLARPLLSASEHVRSGR